MTLLDVVKWVRELRALRRVRRALGAVRFLDAERDVVTGALHNYEIQLTYALSREDPALVAQAELICNGDALDLTDAPESDAAFLRSLNIGH